MSATIPSLWPSVSAPDVLSPGAILRIQAGLLRPNTNGLLEAEFTPERSKFAIRGAFAIIAPQLNRYRYELCRITHAAENPYPVTIKAEGLVQEVQKAKLDWALHDTGPEDDPYEVVASTQDEFVQLIAVLLGCSRTRSIIESLLARTNDLQANTEETSHERDENS